MLNFTEAQNYIVQNFELSIEAHRLITNILHYVDENSGESHAQYEMLHELLGGTIGLEDHELKMLCGIEEPKDKIHNKERE